MALLPIPPPGTPLFDPRTGQLNEVWRRYYQSLDDALSANAAPIDAQYWVSTLNTDLTNEQNIGLLSTGYLKVTTAAGTATPSTVTSIPAGDISSGRSLSRVNDTNVTLTLGGTPSTALLQNTSITAGWTGTLGLARGGTNADLSATGGSGQVLKQASAGAAVTVGQVAAGDLSAGGTFPAIDGSALTAIPKRLYALTAAVSTTGTVKEALATYTLPANTLSTDGQVLTIDAGWTFDPNGTVSYFVYLGDISTGDALIGSTFSPGVAASRAVVSLTLTRRTSSTLQVTGHGETFAITTANVVCLEITGVDFTAANDLTFAGTSSVTGETTLESGVVTYFP